MGCSRFLYIRGRLAFGSPERGLTVRQGRRPQLFAFVFDEVLVFALKYQAPALPEVSFRLPPTWEQIADGMSDYPKNFKNQYPWRFCGGVSLPLHPLQGSGLRRIRKATAAVRARVRRGIGDRSEVPSSGMTRGHVPIATNAG